MRTAIIGGGAAGLCAAVTAAEKGDRVVLYERRMRVGQKLLATGNGRCNLMNTGTPHYPGGAAFALRALEAFSKDDLRRFFERLGLTLRGEAQGRVYPATGQAASVLNVLVRAVQKYHVHVQTDKTVDTVRPLAAGGFDIDGDRFDKLIIASGGMASVKPDAAGGAYRILGDLGHPVTRMKPALVPLKADMTGLKGLAGLRITAAIALVKDGRVLKKETGEILFTDYGLSGVCVMQLGRSFIPGAQAHIDLRPAMGTEGSAEAFFYRRRQTLPFAQAEDFLTGLLATPLAAVVRKRAALTELDDASLKRLTEVVCDFMIPVTDTCGFERAQTTAGGADLAYFTPETMESLLVKRLHAAGEVLDVDGDCGGYNLMFAFCSGILAARAD
jgi:predicted Rossmann fold flavoprotein